MVLLQLSILLRRRYGDCDGIRRHFEVAKYGNYTVFPNVVKSSVEIDTVVLMLHTSFPFPAPAFRAMLTAWNSRASIAVYLQVVEDLALLYRLLEPMAEEPFFRNISLHAYYASAQPPPGLLYPANTGRNLARKFAPRHRYFMTADLDQLYSADAERTLYALAEAEKLEEVDALLVVRRFEHQEGTSAPSNMAELTGRLNRDVFEFHKKSFAVGHVIPGIGRWLDNVGPPKTTPLTYKNWHWEPMFAAPARIPYHNEDVLYGHKDHASLCWLLCATKYKFLLADGVFSSHPGIREPGGKKRQIPKIAITNGENYRNQLKKKFGAKNRCL
ncbi:unnamed protein product, partial [Mesorhabditis spiculigera]